MKHKGLLGFSLIEILLVLALLGLISSVCVVHFDTIQNAFGQGGTQPATALNNAIQQGRLLASQKHTSIFISVNENTFEVKNSEGEVFHSFSFVKGANMRWLAGELSTNGVFKPSEVKVANIEINENGFLKSVFVEFEQEDEKEQYEVDVLTGELKLCQR